jgi:hypothetical protein
MYLNISLFLEIQRYPKFLKGNGYLLKKKLLSKCLMFFSLFKNNRNFRLS